MLETKTREDKLGFTITYLDLTLYCIIITIPVLNYARPVGASRGAVAQMCDYKHWILVVSSIPNRGNKIFLFKFIFSFLRSDIEAKHDGEFHHSTRKTSGIGRRMGNGVS